VVIGVARIPTPGEKTIFASSPIKTAEFAVQNIGARKSAEEAKVLHLLFVTSVYF